MPNLLAFESLSWTWLFFVDVPFYGHMGDSYMVKEADVGKV